MQGFAVIFRCENFKIDLFAVVRVESKICNLELKRAGRDHVPNAGDVIPLPFPVLKPQPVRISRCRKRDDSVVSGRAAADFRMNEPERGGEKRGRGFEVVEHRGFVINMEQNLRAGGSGYELERHFLLKI